MTDIAEVIAGVRGGNVRSCARLISLIEAGDRNIEPVLQALYDESHATPIIGITGPPGVGKSTLLDELVAEYRGRGSSVAVLAVDPSSPFSGGAILGDRLRMARHNSDPRVFIRSMSARGALGGLARAAGDALRVLEAMGRDVIFVETVGVGQSEIDIMRYARTVVVLQPPAAGDSVQAIKAGTLEIGDLLVVTKADLPGADRMVNVLKASIESRVRASGESQWRVPVLKIQTSTRAGIGDLMSAIAAHGEFLDTHPEQANARARLVDALWPKNVR